MLTKILIKHHKGIDSELEEKGKSFSTAASTNIISKFAIAIPNIGDQIKEILRAIQEDADSNRLKDAKQKEEEQSTTEQHT